MENLKKCSNCKVEFESTHLILYVHKETKHLCQICYDEEKQKNEIIIKTKANGKN